jgi:polysaccharide export outer membrane protein
MRIRELIVLAVLLEGCGASGPYVWAKDLPSTTSANEYLISSGDVVGVRVVNQEGMSTRARVRSDGRIALPLLGDVEVRGKTPGALRLELEARFKEYIVAPSVTVNLDEIAPVSVSVLGEVAHPGVISMDAGCGIAQAIAGAGGLTDYASRDRIFVVRNGEKPMRVRFTFDGIAGADPAAVRFALKRGDVVVVE